MQLIDGKATAAAIKAEIAEEVKSIVAKALAFTVSRSTMSASQTDTDNVWKDSFFLYRRNRILYSAFSV